METRQHERARLLEQFSSPTAPARLITQLKGVGVTREMIATATGAKSAEVISNWVAERSAPRSQHFERMDCLRVIVSYLLQTNAFDGEGLAIPMWLNAYPAGRPFMDEAGRPQMTPLQAIRQGEFAAVVDAAQAWVKTRDQLEARGLDSNGNRTRPGVD